MLFYNINIIAIKKIKTLWNRIKLLPFYIKNYVTLLNLFEQNLKINIF